MFLNTLPYVLFILFCVVTSVSDSIFSAWSCIEYFEDTDPNHPVSRSFLKADLAIECGTEEHQRVVNVAWIFVGIWPIGMPLLFFMLMQLCRSSIIQSRRTPFVKATSFLHTEYTINCFWWESFYLLERVTLVGFVMFVDSDVKRLITGLFITVIYMVLLLLFRAATTLSLAS